jgi:hypothetical protein
VTRAHPIHRHLRATAAAVAAALILGACGATVSTSQFKGTQHEVAQVVANLQAHSNSAELDKICDRDITRALREKLKGKSECEQAFKRQLAQTDNLELTVESVTVGAGATTAKAQVKSTFEGKKRSSEVQLVKQEGAWRIAALGPAPGA